MSGKAHAEGTSGGEGQEVSARRKRPQTSAARRARRRVMEKEKGAARKQRPFWEHVRESSYAPRLDGPVREGPFLGAGFAAGLTLSARPWERRPCAKASGPRRRPRPRAWPCGRSRRDRPTPGAPGRPGTPSGAPLLGLELVVDELEDGGLRGVALAGAQPEDPRVAARPVHEAGGDRLEELLDRRPVGDPAGDVAARRDAVVLGPGDELLGEGPELLGLGQRRLDPLVRHERRELVREHRQPVGCRAAELAPRPVVLHGLLALGFDRLELHPEGQAHRAGGCP